MTARVNPGYDWLNRGFVEGSGDAMELMALLERPEWHARAACRGAEPDRWFPGQGQPVDDARQVCQGCQVAVDCREAGLSEKFGIWGGLTEIQRRRLRQERRAAS